MQIPITYALQNMTLKSESLSITGLFLAGSRALVEGVDYFVNYQTGVIDFPITEGNVTLDYSGGARPSKTT